jgi:hypothetical protein
MLLEDWLGADKLLYQAVLFHVFFCVAHFSIFFLLHSGSFTEVKAVSMYTQKAVVKALKSVVVHGKFILEVSKIDWSFGFLPVSWSTI